MEYRGTLLVLDNFRSVLADFDLDLQDVVRSSILDGVDVSEYIDRCRLDARRLDQIRLAMKQGLPSALINALTGDQLYAVRQMYQKGYNIDVITTQISSGRLSGSHLDYLVKWVVRGVDLSGVKLSLIPKSMLEIYDMHLCRDAGFDLASFANGKVFSKDYILYCVSIQAFGKPVKVFADCEWDSELLSYLSIVAQSTSSSMWDLIIRSTHPYSSKSRAQVIVELARKGVLTESNSSLIPLLDDESLSVIAEAAKLGYPYKTLMDTKMDITRRKSLLEEWKMNSGKKVGGTLRRGKHPSNS